MGRAGSGPEFHVNSGSGRVGSLHLWVGSGQDCGCTASPPARAIGERSLAFPLHLPEFVYAFAL